MFVCLSAFYRPHDICPLCGAASESESRSRRGRPRASGQACTARARARMPYNFSTKKSYADAFQKQNRTRAHAVVYVTAEIFKKGNFCKGQATVHLTTTRMCFSGCRSVCSSLDHRRISQSSHLSCVDIIVFYSFHDHLHRH